LRQQKIDLGSALVAIGALALLAALFLDWYSPSLSAWDSFELVDWLLLAIGVGALFTVNTVTGVWNLWESRGVADRRALRTVHALAMLAADAGFVATGVIGRDAVRTNVDRARTHRNVAVASMSVSAVSAAAMLILNRD